ncbi:MAG TPA: RHS repeat-associated core domain-containing protein [Thermoanaerobaculia bacterium]|nr:RHS repeat-associated core domain-containing protein [Thermoanaerobaculia bacterium]
MSSRLLILFTAMLMTVAGDLSSRAHAEHSAIDPSRGEALWSADTAGAHRIGLADSRPALVLSEPGGARAVALDPARSTAWVWTGRSRLSLGFDGTRGLTLPLDLPATVHAHLAVRPEDGSVWLAAGRELRGLSASGATLASHRLPEPAVDLALDPAAGLLLVATAQSVAAHDAVGGALLRALDLGKNPDVRGLSVPPAGGLWIALRDEARRLGPDGTLQASATARNLTALAASPDGGAWLADAKTLSRVGPAGNVLVRIKPFAGQGAISALAAHPADGSVWVAAGSSLAKIDALGRLALRVDLPTEAQVHDLALFADAVPPTIEILAPRDGALLAARSPEVELAWQDAGTGVDPSSLELRLDGASLPVLCGRRDADGATCAPAAPLTEGPHTLAATVRDAAGNLSAPAEVRFSIDGTPPVITLARPSAGAVVVEPELIFEGTVGEPATLRLDGTEIPLGPDGAFLHGPVLLQEGDTTFTFSATDPAGNTGTLAVTVTYEPPAGGGPPPDPATVAPPLDRTVATDLFASVEFLWSGSRPVQTGVAPGAIEQQRVAVIRGKLLARDGHPLEGARISILGHPELGATLSRGDGAFDLAVNGGGVLTVQMEKEGFLTIHRQVEVPWRGWRVLDDAVLLPFDTAATVLTSGSPVLQIARGSQVEDEDGTRRSTLLVPAGTRARLILPDGAEQPLATLTVRATEYTAGPRGPQAMPAPLPPASAYTYAVELSADEAIAAGATEVAFDRPLAHYVDNFLGFPVGGGVPAGYYDRELVAWIPSDNGRIVQVLGVTNGLAELDVDGSGVPAGPSALVALGVTEDERRALASLYSPGQSLWRVPVSHFTPWDYNWPLDVPEDAEPPGPDQEPETEEPEEKACEQAGSIIECQNQVLGEELPATGTPWSLVYRSDRVPGRRTANSLHIPLSGETVPASLKRIELKISIAGRRFTARFPAAAGQVHDFTWDGTDVYGRLLQGRRAVQVEIGYVYPAVYTQPGLFSRSFAQAGSSFSLTVADTRDEITLRRTFSALLGTWSAHPLGFGGWSLSAQHAYDPLGVVQLGGGGRILGAGPLDQALTTLAGQAGTAGYGGEGLPAAQSPLYYPESVAVDPQGNVYVGERTRIRRIDRTTGRIATIAGKPDRAGFSGDGGPAVLAEINYPRGLVFDNAGNLLFADAYNHRIRRITPSGIITTVAGTGEGGFNGDGRAGTEGKLYFPWDVAFDSQGNLYVADWGNNRVRTLTPSGTLGTVGDGSYPVAGFPPEVETELETPRGVAVGPDGGLYVSLTNRHIVVRIEPDGTLRRVAGNGLVDFDGFFRDGVPAAETILSYPEDLAFDRGGNLYVVSQGRVRKVAPTGIITTVAGAGRDLQEGGFARAAWPGATGIALDGRDHLYLADQSYGHRLRKLSPTLPDLTAAETPVAAPDGSEIWIFDAYGRHLRTLDSLTGALRLRFHYDTAGRLAQIEDADGLRTRIERDAAGQAQAVVAPFGQRTELAYANGSLASIRNPAGETVRLTSTPDGLLTGLTDPRNHAYTFTWDGLGRLRRDTDPAGGFKALTRTSQDDAYRIDLTTAEGRTTSYTVESLPSEERRWSNTSPAGLTSEALFRKDGSRRVSFPDGTIVTETPGPDPRFGLQAPVTQSLQVRTPAGRTWTLSSARTATFATPGALLPSTLQETVQINGRSYTSAWNATQRRDTLTTPAGRRRILDLDVKGRPVALQAGNLATVTFGYDTAGRLTEVAQGTGTDRRILAFGYDASGRLDRLTAPLSRNLLFERDAAGRVLRQTLPDSRSIDFVYDAGGNVTGLTPPGRPEHAFGYSPVGLQDAYRPPALGTGPVDTTYAYDLDRRMTRVERPDGKTVTLGYDGAGRLSTLDVSRGRITYTYDPATGKPLSAGSPGGVTLTYTYDGSLLTRTTWTGPVAGTVERTYDNDFRVISEKVNGEAPVTYQYDPDGLLTRAGNLTITRDPQTGLVTGTTLGVVTTSNAYNLFGELIRQEVKVSGHPLFTADYTRDLLGRITRKVEVIESATDTWDYTYDPAGRLQEVYRNGARLSRYEYDANGNRIVHVTPTETITATSDDQDRLLTYGDTTYTYTANGELATKTQNNQTVHYEYDELGNLTKVTMPDGLLIEYLIDGQNRRVGKKVGGVLVQGYLYKDQLEPVATLSGTTGTDRFVYATTAHSPDIVIKGGQTYRLITDHLGSPRLVVNTADGTIAQRMTYDEFGKTILDTGAGSQAFGFAGGLYDRQTELVRFGARDYDARVGRWVGKDPILFQGNDTNLYGYAKRDPMNLIDPSGLRCTNNSPYWVPVKPEENDIPIQWIAPGKTYEGPIDGVRPPAWNNDWFKVSNSTDVTIQPDGNPTTGGIGGVVTQLLWTNDPRWWVPSDQTPLTDRFPGRKQPNWPDRHTDWKVPPPPPECGCSLYY